MSRAPAPIKLGLEPLTVRLEAETVEALEAQAFKRGLPLNTLIRKILGIIAKDNLFEAILEE